MKTPLLLILFFLSVGYCIAQPTVHTDLRTKNWNTIGLRYEKQVKPLVWQTVFPTALRAMNNQVIELPGYIIPTKVGNTFSRFMLSIVPLESCPFCGSGDIPSMIEVKMKHPIEWTDKPVKIRGKFLINDSGNNQSEFFLLNASQI